MDCENDFLHYSNSAKVVGIGSFHFLGRNEVRQVQAAVSEDFPLLLTIAYFHLSFCHSTIYLPFLWIG